MTRLWIVAVACLALAGCTNEVPDDPCLGPADALRSLARDFEGVTACIDVDDCVATTVTLECDDGAHFVLCPVAMHVEDREAYLADHPRERDTLCADADSSCFSFEDCQLREPACEDGRCVMVLAGP